MIAKEFGVLPNQVADALRDDTEELTVNALPLLRYAEAYQAFKHAESEESLKPWRGSPIMEQVKRNVFDLHRKRLKERQG